MNIQQARNAAFIVSPNHEWYRMNAVDDTDVYYHDENTGEQFKNTIDEMEDWTAKVLVDAP